jgi:hypothetical protein
MELLAVHWLSMCWLCRWWLIQVGDGIGGCGCLWHRLSLALEDGKKA